jgi:hypothetical protein
MPAGVESPVSDHRPRRQRAVNVAVSTISLLLLIVGIASLGPLNRAAEINAFLTRLVGGIPQPQGNAVTSAARWGFLAALLVILGAVAALLFLYQRQPWTRYVAVVTSLLTVGICIVLALQGMNLLATNPARGDFVGLANLGTAVVYVMLPGAVAVLSAINVVCLLVLRGQPG